ncbi:MAG: phosphoribosylglycinamide formyltransferase [Thermoplasmataceae archaeon]
MEKRIIVMASGKGTTFQEIYDACNDGRINGKVVALVTDQKNSISYERAHSMKLPIIEYKVSKIDSVITEMRKLKPDLITLAGFLKILPEVFVDSFKGLVVNTHPSLLPCFGGLGMFGINVQKAVLGSGARVTGCTIHMVDKNVDHGPIIAQESVLVDFTDSPESLMERVHKVELKLYVDAISSLLSFDYAIVGNRVIFKNS